MAKDSEFGGDDTRKTQGVQPMQPDAELGRNTGTLTRLLYATDPADPASIPDRNATPVYEKKKEWD